MTDQPNTPLLDKIKLPSDMRDLSNDELRQLADELRDDTVRSVSITGGHLGASLGVVELTVALHHVFDTPVGSYSLGRRAPVLSTQNSYRTA